MKELKKAKNAADCFMVFWKEEIITTSNIIAMQFLLQETKSEELERKCVEYAKKQNAIYYYEKPPGITFIVNIGITFFFNLDTSCVFLFVETKHII